MAKIEKIVGRELLDSRGNPTVEVEVHLNDGIWARALVPSGASTGTHEACELRDRDEQRYLGKGVRNAVHNVNNQIAAAISGLSCNEQEAIDQRLIELDASENKTHLGANAILGTSLAICRAAALSEAKPLYRYIAELFGDSPANVLPVPMMNILNGGAHADNNLDFQEFMIAPVGFGDFSEALRAGVEIFHCLKTILKDNGYATNVGDEGGYAPSLKSHEEAFELIAKAVDVAGYRLGEQIYFACDAAASEFYKDNHYHIAGKQLSSEALTEYYRRLVDEFPIYSLEDAYHEEDWSGWQAITSAIGTRVQLVGDDLFVTNVKRLIQGIEQKAANAILIKVNQIGTLSETLATMTTAVSASMAQVISHRSGETEDAFIADLCVGTNAQQIKTGSLCRTDRTAKYNQLLRIEEELGSTASYAGKAVLRGDHG